MSKLEAHLDGIVPIKVPDVIITNIDFLTMHGNEMYLNYWLPSLVGTIPSSYVANCTITWETLVGIKVPDVIVTNIDFLTMVIRCI